VGPASVERDASAVHAFRLDDAGVWHPAGRLAPDAQTSGIGFGHALALHDGGAYVGASKYGDDRAGAVFVFQLADGTWSQASMVAGTAPGAGLGTSVAVTGSGILVAGAPLQDQQKGQALAFQLDEATGEWTNTASLRPEGQVVHFGATLAPDGAGLWIGALGSAYRTTYDPPSGAWIDAVPIEIERTPGTEFFATAVDLSGDLGVVGFPEEAFGAGTATVLTAADGDWQVAASVFGESDAPPAVRGDDVRCEEGTAVGYPCESVDLLSFVPVTEIGSERGVHLNDIWGWTDPDTGHEWALVGRGDGTAFVDVTNPNDPVFVAEMLRTEGSPPSGWRDIKTLGHYALVVADGAGAHGMQIFDLTRLRDLGAGPTTVEPDVTYDGFGSAHNVIVNEETGFAYAVTGQCGGGLHMVDLGDPLNPVGAGCFTHTGDSPLESSTHDSQCVVYAGPDADYRGHDICFTSGFAGLTISDMTDHESPVMLGIGQVPDAALPHQGWLTEDHRYFLLGDEGDEIQGLVDHTRTLIWDVTELDDPVVLTEYFAPTRAIDHNMYVRGNLVFQANYDAGMRVLDISDIENPREVGYFDTVPGAPDEPTFRMAAWSVYPFFESGTIIVSSGKEGLFVLRYTPKPVS
jgi:choice-of-anchor B domain-containing protein